MTDVDKVDFMNGGLENWRDEPLLDGGGAVDLGIIRLVGEHADFCGDAKLIGHVETVKPTIKRLFGSVHVDLDFRPVEIFTGLVSRKGLLGLDGEAGGFGFTFGELLEGGLCILLGFGLGLVFGKPVHLVNDLLAAFPEHLGSGEFLLGLRALVIDLLPLGFGVVENEKIKDREAREGKEDKKLFFAF